MSPFESLIVKLVLGGAAALAGVKASVWGIKTALGYIEKKLDEVKADLSADIGALKEDLHADIARLERKQEKYNTLQERMARVEDSCANAHKRISELHFGRGRDSWKPGTMKNWRPVCAAMRAYRICPTGARRARLLSATGTIWTPAG